MSVDKVSSGTKYIFACNYLFRRFNSINILTQPIFLQNIYIYKTIITIIIMSKYMLHYHEKVSMISLGFFFEEKEN